MLTPRMTANTSFVLDADISRFDCVPLKAVHWRLPSSPISASQLLFQSNQTTRSIQNNKKRISNIKIVNMVRKKDKI